MSKITLQTIVLRSDEFMTAPLDGELMMMSLERGNYYGLDPVSTQVWEHMVAPIRVADLCAQLVLEFDVALAQCEADVLAFLSDLYEEDMISLVDKDAL